MRRQIFAFPRFPALPHGQPRELILVASSMWLVFYLRQDFMFGEPGPHDGDLVLNRNLSVL